MPRIDLSHEDVSRLRVLYDELCAEATSDGFAARRGINDHETRRAYELTQQAAHAAGLALMLACCLDAALPSIFEIRGILR